MEDKERQSAFLSALNTELFVLQAALGANVNEATARASIYIMALSSFLVAMGFASRGETFGQLVASVLPALFLLGLFTVVRLIDLNGSYLQHSARMARIRSYYRELTPEADTFFGLDLERRPEVTLQLGWGIAFLTTSSSTVAFINNIVAGAGITLLARRMLGAEHTLLGVLLGVGGALILSAAYLAFQRLRFRMFESMLPDRSTGANRPSK